MTKRTIFVSALLILSVALLGLFGSAKIGVVNSQDLISKSDAGAEAATELNTFVQKVNAEMAGAREEFAALQTKLEGLEKSDKTYDKTAADFEAMAQQLARRVQLSRQAVRAKDQELTQKLLPEALKAVRAIGEEEGYTLIFDTNTGSIVYFDDTVELTAKAVSRFNARHNAAIPQ